MYRYWIKPEFLNQATILGVSNGLTGSPLSPPDPYGIFEVTPSLKPVLDESFASVIEAKPTYQQRVLSTSPIMHLPMDEDAGNLTELVQSATFTKSGIQGTYRTPSLLPNREGYSITLPGGSTFWTAPNAAMYETGNLDSWSMAFWFRDDATDTGSRYLMSKRVSPTTGLDGGWRLYRNGTTNLQFRRMVSNNGESIMTIDPMYLTGAHFGVITVTFGSPSVVRCYMDGAFVTSINAALSGSPANIPLKIAGPSWTTGNIWLGAIQHFSLWNRALSAADIADLWRAAH